MKGLIGYFGLLGFLAILLLHGEIVAGGISIICRKTYVCTNKKCHFRGYCEKAWRGNKPSGPPRKFNE